MHITPELKPLTDKFFALSQKHLASTLGIEFLSIEREKLVARMPVDDRTKQPFGLLHGGASVALAETLASVGGWLQIDPEKFAVVGLEINANHVRSVREGFVIGTAVPLHVGRTTQIWETRIVDERGKLVSISRCTLSVILRSAL